MSKTIKDEKVKYPKTIRTKTKDFLETVLPVLHDGKTNEAFNLIEKEVQKGEIGWLEIGIALKNTYYGIYAKLEQMLPAAVRNVTTGFENNVFRIENSDSLNITCSDKEIYNPNVK